MMIAAIHFHVNTHFYCVKYLYLEMLVLLYNKHASRIRFYIVIVLLESIYFILSFTHSNVGHINLTKIQF